MTIDRDVTVYTTSPSATSDERDGAHLRAMLHYATFAQDLLGGGDLTNEDRCTFLAASYCLQLVGGAARQVSQDAIPAGLRPVWPSVVAMRDRMAKEYRTVTPDLVETIIRNDLPSLVAALRPGLQRQ